MRDYLIDSKQKKDKIPSFGKFIELEKLHPFDIEILRELSINARTSILDISHKTNHSPKTIASRLKNLEKNGILQGFGTHICCQEFGYESYQLFLTTQNVSQDRLDKLISYCQSNPNIIFYVQAVGRWNFEIIYEVPNQKKLQEHIIDIRTKFGDIILDLESTVLFDNFVKYNQYPL